jgi:hypothetical protein
MNQSYGGTYYLLQIFDLEQGVLLQGRKSAEQETSVLADGYAE